MTMIQPSISSVPQQIFIPGLNSSPNQKPVTHKPTTETSTQPEKSNDLTALAYHLNENQLNDLFNLLSSNSDSPQQQQQQQQTQPNPELSNIISNLNNQQSSRQKASTKHAKNARNEISSTTQSTIQPPVRPKISKTTKSTPTTGSNSRTRETTEKPTRKYQYIDNNSEQLSKNKKNKKTGSIENANPRISYNNVYNNNNNNNLGMNNLYEWPGSSNECSKRDSRTPDEKYCNLYHLCSNGVYQALLCPEGYLYSVDTLKCELKAKVDCGRRVDLEFDRSNVPYMDYNVNEFSAPQQAPRIINGTLECTLGLDGYFADPEFCNIYHHCLAGVDYAEQCPHQLVWNDKKKMCDWQTSVNCSGRIIPVAQGQTSFCTDKSDNKYADSIYCNVFHHCVGGIDNLVRCDGELQWNAQEKKCDWESQVKCGGKMLPSEKKYNSTFCIGKSDGPYAHEEYCNVYHVCESGTDNIRQCPNQLFWDNKAKRCDWSGKIECTGRTLVTLSTDITLFCTERRDGVYGDPHYCNVYHNCLSGVDFKTKCPDGLIWNETKKDCDWSDSTQCATGNVLKDDTEKNNFCTDKQNGKYAHDMHCNRYYVCQNGKDIIFTCQNNLRFNATTQECDWAVNVNCFGKADYMWEGIKENFCKNKPDGNYPDHTYCNIFHQCQAATDYPKRCSNRLMFNEEKGECDWEDKVDCKGREKLIDTSGMQDESKPETSGDGKGRVTKFCMTKENGNYADLYYCNVYHNCHGGFDTVQYCSNGLAWKQEENGVGSCDWPLSSKIVNGVDCGSKKIFLVDKQSQVDIMATLRSEFCISRGEGLFAHTKYCDLYIHCTAQAVAITMECSPGLIFNEKKRECDYASDDQQQQKATNASLICQPPKQILRPKPTAVGTLILEGADVTGQFPTKFTCEKKSYKAMYADLDWCNIYHVCTGLQDNIFICPPGIMFSAEKKGCVERYTVQACAGTYYKPQKFNKLPNNNQNNNNNNIEQQQQSLNNNFNKNNFNSFNNQLNTKKPNSNNNNNNYYYGNNNNGYNSKSNTESMTNSFEVYY